jgi:non-canonical (house-cleaning) NTP pyrophosphatase
VVKLAKAELELSSYPKKLLHSYRSGKELGEADDIVFHDTNSKQKMGTVGKLTDNAVDRTSYYIDAVVFALIPFKNPTLY